MKHLFFYLSSGMADRLSEALRVRVDRRTAAAYVNRTDCKIKGGVEVAGGITFDYDADDRIVGVEILDGSKRPSILRQFSFELAPMQ